MLITTITTPVNAKDSSSSSRVIPARTAEGRIANPPRSGRKRPPSPFRKPEIGQLDAPLLVPSVVVSVEVSSEADAEFRIQRDSVNVIGYKRSDSSCWTVTRTSVNCC